MGEPRRAGPSRESPRGFHHPRVVRPPAGPQELVELPADRLARRAGRQGHESDRPLPRREDRRRRHHALRSRRQSHAPPPRHLRADGPTALARGDRRLRGRHVAGSFRQGRRPPAGLASLWRTLRASLDGPRALRGYAWQRRRPGHPAGLALPRLPDPRLQCRRPLRPVRPRTARRRPAEVTPDQRSGQAQRIRPRHRPLPHGRTRLPARRHGRRAGPQRGQPNRRRQ